MGYMVGYPVRRRLFRLSLVHGGNGFRTVAAQLLRLLNIQPAPERAPFFFPCTFKEASIRPSRRGISSSWIVWPMVPYP